MVDPDRATAQPIRTTAQELGNIDMSMKEKNRCRQQNKKINGAEPRRWVTMPQDLGKENAQLVDLLKDGKRRSINQPMRDEMESIRTLFERMANRKDKPEGKEVHMASQAAQTSALFRLATEYRKKGTGLDIPNTKGSKRGLRNDDANEDEGACVSGQAVETAIQNSNPKES